MQIGSVAFLALTGLLIFMLIFLAATVNAIIVSLLISLAAAGGFLFFSLACVTAIYIGAMSIAAFVISIATISAIFAAMIAAGIISLHPCLCLLLFHSILFFLFMTSNFFAMLLLALQNHNMMKPFCLCLHLGLF